VTGTIPGVLGVAPVCTKAFFAPQLGQRQKGTPSVVWSKVSMVTRDRHFLQMNCCAVGTARMLRAAPDASMTNYCPFLKRCGD
jgi:hypothetical protein